jgi:Xaa-Pro aminopeptidase
MFLAKLKPFLEKQNIDALLLTSKSSRFYATGFQSSDGVVLALKDKGFFIVDFRYFEAAKEQVQEFDVILQEKGFLAKVKELCVQNNIKSLGFEEHILTVKEYSDYSKHLEDISLIASSDILNSLRQQKKPFELELIKKAQVITDNAFSHILKYIKAGVSEREIAGELEYFIKKSGGQGVSFDTIVLAGKKSSLPHGNPDDNKIKSGDFVLLDFGVVYKGYCSDMTRTVAVDFATEEMKLVYNIVLEAQRKALEIIKAGLTGKEIDKIARDMIENAGYKKAFGHALGHGVGIEVHEEPRFLPAYEGRIPVHSVMTVEPGIYLEGKFGVRIEDLVIINEKSCENLTKSVKELIIL